MLVIDEVVHHARLQRPGTKKRHQRDDILKAIRLEAFDEVLHTPGFELEHRRGLSGLQQGKNGRIVQGYLYDVQRRLAQSLALHVDVFYRPVDNSEGAQAEKVELDQAGIFHIVLVVLGDQATAGLIAEQSM